MHTVYEQSFRCNRRDRFVEVQKPPVNARALCPAEALNSGSRQRRTVITREEEEEEEMETRRKSCVKRESGICLVLTMMSQREEEPPGRVRRNSFFSPLSFGGRSSRSATDRVVHGPLRDARLKKEWRPLLDGMLCARYNVVVLAFFRARRHAYREANG